ncbi:molybdopterin molybdotransferase MoeA [Desulfothermus okinawensis JCM 13304]
MFFKVVTVSEFYNLFQNFTPILDTSVCDAENSLHRVVSEDIVADEDFPPFHRACMDGFAVVSDDTYGASESNPVYLKVVGEVEIDRIPEFSINRGECAKIVTGAPMPDGANAVVMAEYTEEIALDEVEVRSSVSPFQNVILQGEDFKTKDILIEKGTRLRPQEVGILMEFGITKCCVYEPIRVGIISTGNEIVPPDTKKVLPGQIRDVNSYVISSIVEINHAIPIRYGIVPDEKDTLISKISEAISKCHLVLISGGSSIGIKDLTEQAIGSFKNSRILCHGVAISPGKPTLLASIDNTPVVGLPGQVTSAQIVMQLLVAPLIRFLSNDKNFLSENYFPKINAKLTHNIPSKKGREDYVRVRLIKRNDKILAHPIFSKSGIIKSLILSNGLVKVPLSSEGILEGSVVDVFLL